MRDCVGHQSHHPHHNNTKQFRSWGQRPSIWCARSEPRTRCFPVVYAASTSCWCPHYYLIRTYLLKPVVPHNAAEGSAHVGNSSPVTFATATKSRNGWPAIFAKPRRFRSPQPAPVATLFMLPWWSGPRLVFF